MISYDEYCKQLSTDLLLDLDPFQQHRVTISESSKDYIRFQFFIKHELMNTGQPNILLKCLLNYNASYNEPQLHFQIFSVDVSASFEEILDDDHEDEYTLENDMEFQYSSEQLLDPKEITFVGEPETMRFVNVFEFHRLLQSSLRHGNEHLNAYFHQRYHFPILLDSLSSGEIFYSVQNCDSHEIVGGGNAELFSVESTHQHENKGHDQHYLMKRDYLKRWCSVYILPILRDFCATI
ncbi:hypothetical protein ACO0RG_003680 [Hanseniaspora osmophila]